MGDTAHPRNFRLIKAKLAIALNDLIDASGLSSLEAVNFLADQMEVYSRYALSDARDTAIDDEDEEE